MDKNRIIKNRDSISTTKLREQAIEIIEAGINAVLPSTIMKTLVNYDQNKKILTINNEPYNIKGRIFVVGGGKASGLMAEMLEKIIGSETIEEGVVNCKTTDYNTNKIRIIEAPHPIPDERGVNGVKQMLALKEKYSINENDLVICLISGGGSALMPCPVDEISLQDKQEITKLLVSCGATIHEINAVRKHLSKVKGGRLGKFFSPATVVSLIISDVIGNNLDVIASGPTSPDASTFLDAYNILKKFGLISKAPKSVINYLKKGLDDKAKETPKTLDNCHNYIIGDNSLALESMKIKAEELGFKPYIVTAEQKGDPTTAAKHRANEILSGKYADYNLILIGGETTPNLPEEHGKGGRNQHYAAVSMAAMEKYPGEWVVASVGTDGSDFLQDVAGAIVDNNSLASTEEKKISMQQHLDRYDSNTLFEKIGNSIIITGNTGTNVCDVMVYILK